MVITTKNLEAIVKTLTALNGVSYVGLYKNGDVLSANFTNETHQAISNSSAVISQIFMALESVEKTYNEIFIGLNSGYLAGFKLFGGYVVLLLTDKKINFPMISMGIKSASEVLRQLLRDQENLVPKTQTVSIETFEEAPTRGALTPVIHQYVYILTEFLGPAAKVVVEDALGQWKSTYIQTSKNLPHLVALLESELETVEERLLFKTKADSVTVPDM